MGLSETKRKYDMPDADLIQKADALIAAVTRDMSYFTARGITSGQLSDFQDIRDAFSDSDTDEELLGELTVATADKEAKRYQLEKEARQIRSMADIEYQGTGLYKSFGFDDLTHQTDNDLVRSARRIHRVATKLQTDLATQGLNAAMLTTFKGYSDDLDTAIDAVEEAKETRDMRTQQRIQLANDLFDMMMKFSSIGKSIFEDIDEAKYNDYVVYNSQSPAPSAGQP